MPLASPFNPQAWASRQGHLNQTLYSKVRPGGAQTPDTPITSLDSPLINSKLSELGCL